MQTLNEPSWALGATAIVVFCKSQAEARARVRTEYERWAELAARFCKPKALLKYPNCKGEGFPVLASEDAPKMMLTVNSDLIAQVYTSPLLPVNKPLMQILERMVESDRPMFLLSNPTNLAGNGRSDGDDQLWLNQLAVDMVQSSGAECVTKNMKNYWNAADLESLHVKLRDASTAFNHQYRAILNDANPVWFEAVSRYEPVELNGRSFRLSINQDFKILGASDRLAPMQRR